MFQMPKITVYTNNIGPRLCVGKSTENPCHAAAMLARRRGMVLQVRGRRVRAAGKWNDLDPSGSLPPVYKPVPYTVFDRL